MLLLSCFIVLASYSKADIHLFINSLNSNFADIFFKYITNVGDGFFVIVIAVLLLMYKIRLSINIAGTYAISGLFAQIVKHVFDSPRPIAFFEGKASLHLVDGVKMLSTHSFPSGHSASAFAFFLCLAMAFNKRWIEATCLLMASVVAYSRMYLSQHFLIDIATGSLIGVITVLIFNHYSKRWNKEWLDKPIYKLHLKTK
jgi:membrane-associated phospholipid phosphatase